MSARLDAAREYLGRGMAPLPVPHRAKSPGFEGWPQFTVVAEHLPQHFAGIGNIGILLGERSRGLIDIDLDCAEAVALAPDMLPPTGAIFGRASKPASHWLYRCEPSPETRQFQFVKAMLVELRSTGEHTVFPPSVHLSGEAVEWAQQGEPTNIPSDQLLQMVGDLAGISLLVRNWPELSGRYNVEGALIGALLRAGRPEDEVERLIGIIQKHAGKSRQHAPAKAVPRLAAMLADGKPVPGLRRLKELLGADIVVKVAEWMGLQAGHENLIDPAAPYTTAKMFRETRYAVEDTPTLYHHRGDFFAWNGSAYPEVDDREMRAVLYGFLDDCVMRAQVEDRATGENKTEIVPVKPNTSKVNNLLDALKAATLLPAAIAAPSWLAPVEGVDAGDVIACANGLLHLPTGRLLPHTPTYFTRNALNFAYEPGAFEPRQWLAFLKELWPDDDASISALQEIFGYLLGADTEQEKAFLLVGPKRSGKGTIARVLTRLVGAENVVAPTLAGLGTNFGLAPLIGKRVAIISDARLSGRADQAVIAERLLSITGEDGITVDRKYKDGWTGQLGVRFLILSNELPRLNDASGALASRFIVLVLTVSFYGREDPGLTNRLLEELPGILNWAIEGWRRLRHRGHFVQPETAREVVEELEALGSPIGTFIKERCDIGTGRSVSVDDLFGEWRFWCAEQGRDQPGNKQSFGRDLRASLPAITTSFPRSGEGRTRYYEGIGIRGIAGAAEKDEGQLPGLA